MPHDTFHSDSTPLEAVLSVIAALGGAARYVHETLKHNRPFSFLKMLAKAFVSWFVGTSAAHLSMSWGLDADTAFVFAAIFGWLGADGAEMLVEYLKRRFFPPTT